MSNRIDQRCGSAIADGRESGWRWHRRQNAVYEKLRSIKFTPAASDRTSSGGSGLESAIGPAVAGLLKGTKHLMKTSAPGLAAAGIAHVASTTARTSYLTIATDRQIYTLSNQIPNSVGLKTAKKGHVDVGLALESAGHAVLGIDRSSISDASAALPPTVQLRQQPLRDQHHLQAWRTVFANSRPFIGKGSCLTRSSRAPKPRCLADSDLLVRLCHCVRCECCESSPTRTHGIRGPREARP